MSFFRKISPTGAVKDFVEVWTANPYRWPVLAAAMGVTLMLMIAIIPKSEIVPPDKPEITYITTLPENRSDAEIIASNKKHQLKQDELRKQEAAQEEAQKQLYRTLGKATFVDTDAMEKQIARDKAADEAAAKKKREQEAAQWKAEHPDKPQ
ncbi:MAG: hypothetical protein P0Y56_13275 [Candidatus Andeanibacterium colombiense]|uniref:Uncharacterized protein n=1 Tax=Candidatus Andeanibacterium colombiense TaxID=3121345 RepID=A0AAJ5X5K1_9SPHN|nr:MAG: hypothetical protein P0Y56_13275 [Sphingomonadaceae bacterium]